MPWTCTHHVWLDILFNSATITHACTYISPLDYARCMQMVEVVIIINIRESSVHPGTTASYTIHYTLWLASHATCGTTTHVRASVEPSLCMQMVEDVRSSVAIWHRWQLCQRSVITGHLAQPVTPSHIYVHHNQPSPGLTSGGFMLRTLVILPCMIRKWGLLTLSWTDRNRSFTERGLALLPLIRYFSLPPITIYDNKMIWGAVQTLRGFLEPISKFQTNISGNSVNYGYVQD